jgi:hypothetical protein
MQNDGVKIQWFGKDQVMITSRDRGIADQAIAKFREEHSDRSWRADPVSTGRYGGAYVESVGAFLVAEPHQPALSASEASEIASSFLDGLDGAYALGCVLSHGIAFTQGGEALRTAYCQSNYELVLSEIYRIGRERYDTAFASSSA